MKRTMTIVLDYDDDTQDTEHLATIVEAALKERSMAETVEVAEIRDEVADKVPAATT